MEGDLFTHELRGKKKASYFKARRTDIFSNYPTFARQKIYPGETAFINHQDFLLRVSFEQKKFKNMHMLGMKTFRLEQASVCLRTSKPVEAHAALLRFWNERSRFELLDHQSIALNKTLNTIHLELVFGIKMPYCPTCFLFSESFKNGCLCPKCRNKV